MPINGHLVLSEDFRNHFLVDSAPGIAKLLRYLGYRRGLSTASFHWPISRRLRPREAGPAWELMELLAARLSREVTLETPPDYVVVYDNGGPSLQLAYLLTLFLSERYKASVDLVVVTWPKYAVEVCYFEPSTGHSTRGKAAFKKAMQKRALFFVDVLDRSRAIIRVAKTAATPINEIDVLGIASLMLRNATVRDYARTVTGLQTLETWAFCDLGLNPHPERKLGQPPREDPLLRFQRGINAWVDRLADRALERLGFPVEPR